jgi:hypothetical protein
MPALRRAAASGAARVFAATLALAFVAAWQLPRQFSSAIAGDPGDPLLNTWILWWNAHRVPLTDAWWNATFFYPTPGVFAFSESLLAFAPVASPLLWLGVSPVAAYNLLFLAARPLACVGGYALGWTLTRRRDAAVIAALAFGFAPYRLGQVSHLQVLWSCWMPLGLAALHRYLDTRAPRWLTAFAVAWFLNALTNGYYLVFFALLVAGWTLWFARTWAVRVRIGLAAVAASLPLAPLLAGYQARQAALGLRRVIGEIQFFSADLVSVASTSPRAWLSQHWTRTATPEAELYPGLVVAGLVIWAVVASWRAASPTAPFRRWRRVTLVLAIAAAALALGVAMTGGWDLSLGPLHVSMHRASRPTTAAFWLGVATVLSSRRLRIAWQARSPLAFYVFAAAGALLLAMGPSPQAFGEEFVYKGPYSWLMELPGGDSLRVPARIAMVWALCLAAAAAIAWARIERRRVAIGAASAFILAEGFAFTPVAVLAPPPPVPALAAGVPVLELPAEDGPFADLQAMYRAMSHGHPVINGFSGYFPPHYPAVQTGLIAHDDTVLSALTARGTLVVFVDRARDTDGATDAWIRSQDGASELSSSDTGTWFELPARAGSSDAPGDRIDIRAATGDGFEEDAAGAMWDMDLTTRWHTAGPRKPGDRIALDLGEATAIGRIEMDLGAWTKDYPTGLSIAVGEEPSSAQEVWTGSVRGALITGALAHPKAATFAIDLPPGTSGRYVVLTNLGADVEFSWTVAEIRLFRNQ